MAVTTQRSKAAAKRAEAVEAAFRAALSSMCGYRRSQSTWAGGEHENQVCVVTDQVVRTAAEERTRLLGVAERAEAHAAKLKECIPAWERGENGGVVGDDNAWAHKCIARDYATAVEYRALARRARAVINVAQPDAMGGSTRAWSRNGKWSGCNSWQRYTIRADWRERVEALGVAVIRDGENQRIVLDCDESRGPLRHVLVVLPSRGFNVRLEWRWVNPNE